MQPSTLLIASLGAIFILLATYMYIYMFERKHFLILWFIGRAVIAFNYGLDAFFPDVLRRNRLIFLLSLGSYFYANLLISCGVFSFLRIKADKLLLLSAALIWLTGFVFFSLKWPDIMMINYTNAAVFLLMFWVGTALIKAGKRHGKFAIFLGALNIVWVGNTILFAYILKLDQLAPYVVSHIILLMNAIGLVHLFFREQKGAIECGLAHITYLSDHDELTGLYNKTYFDRKIQELNQNRDCLPISVLVGDMNGLKFVNDVFGHQEGDNWIKRMAFIMQRTCRSNDIIARWGGDEFAAILPYTDRQEAAAVAARIKAACEHDQKSDISFSISLGWATKTDKETGLSEVLRESETIMYETKLVEGKKARSAIAEAIETRLYQKGHETKEHLARLQNLAVEFARTLNLSAENLADLLIAAKLHDVGKIGIAEEVVLKESRLDESEWTMLKKHVEIGYRIVHALDGLAHLADIVLYHHEWWNGQGYPQGLKGEEIPLMSRIISILHAFDAMTHRQMGQPALTTEAALDELRLKAGTQFDPDLIPLFIEMAQTWPEPKLMRQA